MGRSREPIALREAERGIDPRAVGRLRRVGRHDSDSTERERAGCGVGGLSGRLLGPREPVWPQDPDRFGIYAAIEGHRAGHPAVTAPTAENRSIASESCRLPPDNGGRPLGGAARALAPSAPSASFDARITLTICSRCSPGRPSTPATHTRPGGRDGTRQAVSALPLGGVPERAHQRGHPRQVGAVGAQRVHQRTCHDDAVSQRRQAASVLGS
jgi:hypothetical protein